MTDHAEPGVAGADGAARRSDGSAWDSALSSQEFAAVKGAGFEPVGQVLGTAVFSIGYSGVWGCPGAWSVTDGVKVPSSPWASSLAVRTKAMYEARRLALRRAMAECRTLGADGIVGVTLRIGEFPAGGQEFTALGTAVRARSRIRPRLPFTSHLGGQDFAKLIHTGWVPTGLAFGIAAEIRHDDWRTSRRVRWTAGNQEIDGYSQLLGHVRHEARKQVTLDAAKHGGDGVVVDEVDLTVTESECSGSGYSRDLTAQAVFVGTTIARFRRPEQPVRPEPLTIMRLEREH
ncbi:heavy metal-binding domain-containing protein [Streptomyces hundungensis]|uniref:heavy metal-binding domain-containing protein n=1 Tax=Streptomyces hundungensis TaxID=1077946 RepID=UPI0033D476A5